MSESETNKQLIAAGDGSIGNIDVVYATHFRHSLMYRSQIHDLDDPKLCAEVNGIHKLDIPPP